jgi:hypothetical protein
MPSNPPSPDLLRQLPDTDRQALLAAQRAEATSGRLLQEGSQGEDVRAVQSQLDQFGAHLKTDGIFGPATDQAVRQFQTAHSLNPDGIVGPKTWAVLAHEAHLAHLAHVQFLERIHAAPTPEVGGVLPNGDRVPDTQAAMANQFVDDQNHVVTVPSGPREGMTMLYPDKVNPHDVVALGVADGFVSHLAVVVGPAALLKEGSHLLDFFQGGDLDAQRIGGELYQQYVDYATVAIGLYGAAAGIPEAVMLKAEDLYAAVKSDFGNTQHDTTYTHLAERNVVNTKFGYDLYESGRVHASLGDVVGKVFS